VPNGAMWAAIRPVMGGPAAGTSADDDQRLEAREGAVRVGHG
jgi:hypothetical protein